MNVYKNLVFKNFSFMYKMYNWKGEKMTSNVSLLTYNSPVGSVRKVSDPKWHKALRLSGLGVGWAVG